MLGCHGLDVRNQVLREALKHQQLSIMNTCMVSDEKTQLQYSWTHPSTRCGSVIDFVLV